MENFDVHDFVSFHPERDGALSLEFLYSASMHFNHCTEFSEQLHYLHSARHLKVGMQEKEILISAIYINLSVFKDVISNFFWLGDIKTNYSW